MNLAFDESEKPTHTHTPAEIVSQPILMYPSVSRITKITNTRTRAKPKLTPGFKDGDSLTLGFKDGDKPFLTPDDVINIGQTGVRIDKVTILYSFIVKMSRFRVKEYGDAIHSIGAALDFSGFFMRDITDMSLNVRYEEGWYKLIPPQNGSSCTEIEHKEVCHLIPGMKDAAYPVHTPADIVDYKGRGISSVMLNYSFLANKSRDEIKEFIDAIHYMGAKPEFVGFPLGVFSNNTLKFRDAEGTYKIFLPSK